MIEAWCNDQKYLTEADFWEYATDTVIKPGLEKYTRLFVAERGDHTNLMKAFNASRVFNPMFVKENGIDVLTLLVDDLKHFGPGFKEFATDEFCDTLKSELKELKNLAAIEFDWSNTEKSKQYEERKQRRRLRFLRCLNLTQIGEDAVGENRGGRSVQYNDWKDDPGEVSRRIYGWWTTMLIAKPTSCQTFRTALRLVVLMQPSSASVERVFSQLNHIRRRCGYKMLEETLEVRLMLRYQLGKGNDFE